MSLEIYKLSNTEIDKSLLFNYLLDVNNDFEIPLDKKITDLKAYAFKLLEQGNVIMMIDNGIPVSMISYYTNDFVSFIAYWPILSTKKCARGKKYAKTLIQLMIQDCKEKKFKSIKCDSVNPIAIVLYKSIGFVEYQRTIDGGIEKVYLEYKL